MTAVHTRQLQQYTRPTNNNYTKDNLKLATIHTRQIRINTRVKQTGELPKLKLGAATHVTVELSQSKSDSLLCTVHN